MKVGFGNVSNGNGLTQLRLIVPIINSRQHITSFDVLPLLDGFFHNLSQDFCADSDVFVAGDYITRACQQHAGLAVRPRHYHHRLHCGRPANRLGVNDDSLQPQELLPATSGSQLKPTDCACGVGCSGGRSMRSVSSS